MRHAPMILNRIIICTKGTLADPMEYAILR